MAILDIIVLALAFVGLLRVIDLARNKGFL